MKRAALGSIVAVAALLAASCGSTRQAAPHGFLLVGIEREGGGDLYRYGQLFGGRVEVYDAHGHFVRAVQIKSGSRAKVELPPGRYSIGLGHGRPTVAQLQGCKPEIAKVIADRTASYTLYHGCWAL